MVPEGVHGGIQSDGRIGHRQRINCEGRQAARHGTRHAGHPATRPGRRLGGQQHDRIYLHPSQQEIKIIFSLVKTYTLYNLYR